MKTKVTKRVVDAATRSARDTFIWDADLKGFGLKVTPKNRKIYILQTRLNGRLRCYTIGVHGSPWTPDMARGEATRLLGLIKQGVDPADERNRANADLMNSSTARSSTP